MDHSEIKPIIDSIIGSTTISDLKELSLRYMSLSNPSIHLYLGQYFGLRFSSRTDALNHYVLGMKCGLGYPCRYWDDMEIDSIGQCIGNVILDFYKSGSEQDQVFQKLLKLAFIYVSRCIDSSLSGRPTRIVCEPSSFLSSTQLFMKGH
jgi:hypothetical protein